MVYFYFPSCRIKKGQIRENPGKCCKDILDSSFYVHKSGLYWIKPDGDSSSVQTYCDMNYQDGGWTLAGYGYVATSTVSTFDLRNKDIPIMNHPNGFTCHPNERTNSQGVIPLDHGAVNLVQNAKFMIVTGGGNPVSGGISKYSYTFLSTNNLTNLKRFLLSQIFKKNYKRDFST